MKVTPNPTWAVRPRDLDDEQWSLVRELVCERRVRDGQFRKDVGGKRDLANSVLAAALRERCSQRIAGGLTDKSTISKAKKAWANDGTLDAIFFALAAHAKGRSHDEILRLLRRRGAIDWRQMLRAWRAAQKR